MQTILNVIWVLFCDVMMTKQLLRALLDITWLLVPQAFHSSENQLCPTAVLFLGDKKAWKCLQSDSLAMCDWWCHSNAWSFISQLTPVASSSPALVLKTNKLWSQQFQTLEFLYQTVLQGLKSDGRGHFLGCCSDPEQRTLSHRILLPGHPPGQLPLTAHGQLPLSAMLTPPAWPCLYLIEEQQEIIL